jgi:uncharacterized protein YigA (DUF484 family)
MNPNDIVGYLKEHPGFFEDHAELLAEVTVPHPLSGQAIPLVERQVMDLRQKNRVLESKLNELIQFGEENDRITERVHRLSVSLILARDLDTALSVLYGSMHEEFGVPHVAARLWRGAGEGPEFGEVTDVLRDYAAGLVNPFCGPNANFESASWFVVGSEHVRSVAFIGIRDPAGTFGLLALGSEDARRFYPEMGTLFLGRIGELASAALSRYL